MLRDTLQKADQPDSADTMDDPITSACSGTSKVLKVNAENHAS